MENERHRERERDGERSREREVGTALQRTSPQTEFQKLNERKELKNEEREREDTKYKNTSKP